MVYRKDFVRTGVLSKIYNKLEFTFIYVYRARTRVVKTLLSNLPSVLPKWKIVFGFRIRLLIA